MFPLNFLLFIHSDSCRECQLHLTRPTHTHVLTFAELLPCCNNFSNIGLKLRPVDRQELCWNVFALTFTVFFGKPREVNEHYCYVTDKQL